MKKKVQLLFNIALLNAMLLLTCAAIAQNRSVLMNETFDYSVGTLPPGWTVMGNGASSWGVYNNSSAGGTAPEMRMYYSPSFVGESRLMSQVLNSGDATSFKLSLNIFFRYYALSHTVKIGYSTDNGATWTDFWQQVCTANYGPKLDEHYFTIPANTNFRLGFYYSGDNYNIWDYNLDNIKVESVAPIVPLAGTYYIPAGSPGYPTISAAIADLNYNGAGSGGVTFKIAANYTETFSSPAAGLITASGTLSDPVLFIKDGTGANPLITAGVGTSTTTDGIIKIAGGDYITFDGIDLQENSLNLDATTQAEWGYALIKASAAAPFNGCQHITIKNCSITLNKANVASVGIYSGNHIASNTTALTITNVSDAMNDLKLFNNSISNVYRGIALIGFNNFKDSNVEIGVEGANIVTNFGGPAGGTGLTPQVYGIYTWNSSNVQVANNTVNGGAGTTTLLYGIRTSDGANGDVYNNSVTLSGGSTRNVYGIGSELGATGTTVNIHHNIIENCSLTSATTSLFYGIQNQIVSTVNFNVNIYGNEIRNNLLSGTGNFIGIDGGFGGIIDIYENSIHDNTKDNSGQVIMIKTGTSGTKYQIRNNIMYMNNIITVGTVTASSTITGFYSLGSPGEFFNNNQIYNCYIGGTFTGLATIYGVNAYSLYSLSKSFYGNTIYNLAINSGSGTVYGILFGNVMAGNSYTLRNNNIYNLSAAGTSGAVTGIHISGGNGLYVYNNFVSDLKAPDAMGANAINGINIAGGTLVNAYYNTVYLNASSTATTFGSSGLYKSATVNSDFRNNCIVNVSVPGSTGKTVAFRWSGAFNSTYYNVLSNNNNWYAGTPGPANFIFYDGTNNDQTLTDFQTRVSPRESNSVTEMPPFKNVATAPYDLHMMTSVPTLCDGGAFPVTSPIAISDDFDGDVRSATPDIGADEFEVLPVVHNISLPAGWSGVSSYISPVNPDMAAILSPISNNLILINNFIGMYYPAGGIFTLNTWDDHSGYVINMSDTATLPIGTTEVTNKTVNLSEGWNLIPVLSSSPYNTVDLFSGVGGLDIVKDVAGNGVYWPAYGIGSIEYLLPGRAYYVRMSTGGNINFTASDNLTFKPANTVLPDTPWNQVVNTPASHVVAFKSEPGPFMTGDIIGGFTPDNICAGTTEILNPGEPFALCLNGDDAATSVMEGFIPGNLLKYKLYRPSTGETFELDLIYDQNMNTGSFEFNGVSVVTSVKMSITGISDSEAGDLKIYPNPSPGHFTIDGSNKFVNVRLFNALGDEVYFRGVRLPAQINIPGLPKGVYVVKMETDRSIKTEKITIQ